MHNSPFLSGKIPQYFTNFTRDMRILPNDTPLILAALDGQIKKTKNLPSCLKMPFPTLSKFIDKGDFKLCYDDLLSKGVCIARTSKDEKCFLVISLCDGLLLRCIGASFSENGALNLDDYLLKLCSYKDYLDSFERLHYETDNSLPFIKMLKSRISGASSIIEIANTQGKNTLQRKVAADDLVKMLLSFTKLSDAPMQISVEANCKTNGTGIFITQDFLKLCVSCLGLVIKNSKQADVVLEALEEGGFVYLKMKTKSKKSTGHCVYESAVLRALGLCGYNFSFCNQDGIYAISFRLKAVPAAELVLSDAKKEQEYLSGVLSTEETHNIFLASSDFVF